MSWLCNGAFWLVETLSWFSSEILFPLELAGIGASILPASWVAETGQSIGNQQPLIVMHDLCVCVYCVCMCVCVCICVVFELPAYQNLETQILYPPPHVPRPLPPGRCTSLRRWKRYCGQWGGANLCRATLDQGDSHLDSTLRSFQNPGVWLFARLVPRLSSNRIPSTCR